MDTFGVDGGSLEFMVRGNGPPLLLVHGSIFADPWESMLSHGDLLADYQIIRYHRRGYGGSSPAAPGRTLGHEGADAIALLDHLGTERANVVGHSLAANIVLQAAIDAPNRFSTMSLLEPGMFTVPAAAGMGKALGAVAQVYESGDHRQAMLLFLGGPRGAEMMAQLEGKLPPGAADAAVADTPALFGLDLPAGSSWVLDEGAARSLHVPTLLGLGSDTSPVYEETHTALSTLLPDAEQLAVADSGHFLHVEQPEQVATSLAAFLRRHR